MWRANCWPDRASYDSSASGILPAVPYDLAAGAWILLFIASRGTPHAASSRPSSRSRNRSDRRPT